MSIYNVLVLCCWLVFIGFWGVMAVDSKRTIARTYGGLGLLLRISTSLVALAALRIGVISEPKIHALGANPFLGTLGVVLCGFGVALAIWSRIHLGANWGMPMSVKENPELVQSGPYAYVRHPIYSGVLLAILGSTLVASPWWLVAFVAGASYFIYSAVQEERQLSEQFGLAYALYKRQTRMIIPFLW